MSEFDEYKRLGEPEKKEKSEIWQTAIGLQKVDGLTPSAYLIQTARSNIEGDISFEESKRGFQVIIRLNLCFPMRTTVLRRRTRFPRILLKSYRKRLLHSARLSIS